MTRKGERRLLAGRPHVLTAEFLFGWSIFLMLTLHIAEILIWAFTLNHLGLIARVHDAIYFCANAYTTLGYGTVALEPQWRNISPVIAISGPVRASTEGRGPRSGLALASRNRLLLLGNGKS
jgi:hypothetical protein